DRRYAFGHLSWSRDDSETVLVAEPSETRLSGDAVGITSGVPAAPLPGCVGAHGGGPAVPVRVRLGQEPFVHQGGLDRLDARVGDRLAGSPRVRAGSRDELRQVHLRLDRLRQAGPLRDDQLLTGEDLVLVLDP